MVDAISNLSSVIVDGAMAEIERRTSLAKFMLCRDCESYDVSLLIIMSRTTSGSSRTHPLHPGASSIRLQAPYNDESGPPQSWASEIGGAS